MPPLMYKMWLTDIRTDKNAYDADGSVNFNLPARLQKISKLTGLPVMTLTQGKFDEFPERDTATNVGTVRIDIVTGKVIGPAVRDSIWYSDASLNSRFMSVDPLTKSYPWYSPYQFAGNTPIQAIDIDGLEPLPYYIERFKREYPVLATAAGIAQGTVDFAKETYQFVSADAWKASTWKNAGKNLLAGASGFTLFEGEFGMDILQRRMAMTASIDNFIKNIPNMTAYDWSYTLTKLGWTIAGAKGVGEAMEATRGLAYEALGGFNQFLSKSSTLSAAATTFENLWKGSTFIKDVKKGIAISSGNVHEAWGGLMKEYGVSVEDLTFSKDGATSAFKAGDKTYTLYPQTSAGDYGKWSIQETITDAKTGAKSTSTIRFKSDD